MTPDAMLHSNMNLSIFRRAGAALLSALLLLSLPASAQDRSTGSNPARQAKLDGICAEGLARFCPALADRPGQTMSQVTCLKPYRSSLSLSCRRAVTAALR